MLEDVKTWLLSTQAAIFDEFRSLDPDAEVVADRWTREQGGGGESRILREGGVFERAGVNFSHVHGNQLPAAASASRPELAGRSFEALGVSVVAHPRNPHAPTSHCNVRFFIAADREQEPVWWFGGGFDLTPYYPRHDDVVEWHREARDACNVLGEAAYPRFKQWCDEYFYLPHRGEARGVGGIFFDDLREPGFERVLAFSRRVADGYRQAYASIVARRSDERYGERERRFQLLRRGRYVEFNLLQDRGTLFGLQSGGRTESILMSLPPAVAWDYCWEAEPGSAEALLATEYLRPRDWLAEDGNP